MIDDSNLQVRLAARPVGLPTAETWSIGPAPVPQPKQNGEVLVKLAYISLDPAMRGWIEERKSYVEPVAAGAVMRGGGVGTVMASRHPDFAEGDQVVGMTGVQSYAVMAGRELTKVSDELAPLPTFLGALGMPGMTAYFGLLDVGALKEGDTVLISGAAGAVGSIAGQIAKNKGAGRVVGIAGSDEKCRHIVDELGYDAAINYKTQKVVDAIRETCPDGIDVYFDNVGGSILDDALACLRRGARVVICGAISQYNDRAMRGPANYMSLLVNRARMQGFLVFDYRDRYAEAFAEMASWLSAGKLVHRETIVKGLETFPQTFLRLFSGEKLGKLIIEV